MRFQVAFGTHFPISMHRSLVRSGVTGFMMPPHTHGVGINPKIFTRQSQTNALPSCIWHSLSDLNAPQLGALGGNGLHDAATHPWGWDKPEDLHTTIANECASKLHLALTFRSQCTAAWCARG